MIFSSSVLTHHASASSSWNSSVGSGFRIVELAFKDSVSTHSHTPHTSKEREAKVEHIRSLTPTKTSNIYNEGEQAGDDAFIACTILCQPPSRRRWCRHVHTCSQGKSAVLSHTLPSPHHEQRSDDEIDTHVLRASLLLGSPRCIQTPVVCTAAVVVFICHPSHHRLARILSAALQHWPPFHPSPPQFSRVRMA